MRLHGPSSKTTAKSARAPGGQIWLEVQERRFSGMLLTNVH